MITRLCANVALLARLDSWAFSYWGSNMNNSLRAIRGYVELLVVVMIISISVYLMFVLLHFNRRMIYWSSWEKVMSDWISFVIINFFRFANSPFVYVNSLIQKILAQAILNAILLLRSWMDLGLPYVICWRISLVIDKQSFLIWGNNYHMPWTTRSFWRLSKTNIE